MAQNPIDTICFDCDDAEVQLCKWDGSELKVERLGVTDSPAVVADGIRRLGPRPRFRLLYRIAEDTTKVQSHDLEILCRKLGASYVRRLPLDIQTDPGLTAARQAADQHRLGGIVCVERRKTSVQFAAVDLRGDVLVHSRCNETHEDEICTALARLQEEAKDHIGSDTTLVVYGYASSATEAVHIGQLCGFRQVLIPDYAASLSVVGMLMVNLVIQLRTPESAIPLDRRRIRETFVRLMDEASRQVTLEGYDIDDTLCERLVETSQDGEIPPRLVPLEALTNSTASIQAVHVRVTIQTQKFALPPSSEGTGNLVQLERVPI
jgi:hypothetical protein